MAYSPDSFSHRGSYRWGSLSEVGLGGAAGTDQGVALGAVCGAGKGSVRGCGAGCCFGRC